LRAPKRTNVQRWCAAIAVGVLAVALLRVAEPLPISYGGESGHATLVASASRPHSVQAPHLAGIVGAAVFVALALLSCGVAVHRRDAVVPTPQPAFRRRGPPPPSD